jgi:topoisomerase IV subunit A
MSTRVPQQEFSFNASGPGRKRRARAPAKPAIEVPPKDVPHHVAYDSGHGPLKELLDRNFLEYASYVICERAIPHLDDGLKPVQRRILHSLHERDDGRFMKVANIVGHCMQYHPHGDTSIADALVNLTNKGYLIEGQGNFGNIYTGDRAAASRYIECRLTDLARKEVFNKALTEYTPSYDGRNKEPVTLPAKLPLLLMLGAEGIAVGMSTRILPHNFPELLKAQIAILQKKPFEILPDFQQGGLMDVSEYNKGNGKIRVRACIEKRDDRTLVIIELPFGTTTESLISSIEDAVRKKKVAVRSISDFTAEKVEIELKLASGAKPDKVLKSLYAFTICENSVSSRVVVIRGNRPAEMNVDEILQENTARLKRLLQAELEHRKGCLLDDLHNKTLVQIFVENRIYKRIEECKSQETVRQAVFDGLAPFADRLRRPVTKDDVEMLLGIRIRRISLFDINKNKKDIEDILAELKQIEKNLASLVRYAVRYLKRLLKQYGDQHPRRTRTATFSEIEVRKLTATELEVLYDKENGYIGTAVKGQSLLQCSSLDKLFLAWKDGRYRVVTPPEKLFVDKTLAYCEKPDRERVMTVVYTLEQFTYIKRFRVGGTILNRDYRYAPEDAKVLLFEIGTPDEVFLKYRPAKSQRIHQQVFHPNDVAIKGVKARGNQMTAKSIARLATKKPAWWDEADAGPKGMLL